MQVSSCQLIGPVYLLPACDSHASHVSAHWSYEGEAGPEHWGDLSPDWALAKTGRQQSPIDLTRATAADVPDLAFDYRATPLEVVNNGHAIQVNCAGGGSATLGGERYVLAQFHFHSPSEHTIDGEHAALEAHLVHQNAAGGLAFVGVMIHPGTENAALAKVWAHLPTGEGPARAVPGVSVSAADLLPGDLTSYRYPGSLTTPPCSEGVRWIIMSTPIEASQAQIEALRAIISNNNRPVQPLHGRALRIGE